MLTEHTLVCLGKEMPSRRMHVSSRSQVLRYWHMNVRCTDTGIITTDVLFFTFRTQYRFQSEDCNNLNNADVGLGCRMNLLIDTSVRRNVLFPEEDAGSMFLRNVGVCRQVHTALQPTSTSLSP
jgi:hypothetical protein